HYFTRTATGSDADRFHCTLGQCDRRSLGTAYRGALLQGNKCQREQQRSKRSDYQWTESVNVYPWFEPKCSRTGTVHLDTLPKPHLNISLFLRTYAEQSARGNSKNPFTRK